jgi:UDP-N-acetylmuramoylalanine--D-glutamate ligase
MPMPDPKRLFQGKRITVMGLGLLGRGLKDTLFLIRCGARVTVTDLKNEHVLAAPLRMLKGLDLRLKLGGHDPEDFIHADMILRNADVPRSSEFLALAKDHGVPIEMDESLFCKHFEGQVVGITGTRGKTTTTVLTHRILSSFRPGVFLSGNIMGEATLPLLDTAGLSDIVVLELSSWQLQGFHDARLSPNAAVFTNIHADHLNRYSGMEDYIQDKKAIYLYQAGDDFCLFNKDQPETAALADEAPAGKAFFSLDDIPQHWSIPLPGAHNRENVAAAVGLTRKLGVPDEIIRAEVEAFEGVEHRLQWLGEKDGIGFVNDSTSTTPVAGCAALAALQGRRILLIAGGADKKLDPTPFAMAAAEKTEKIALLEGEGTVGLERELAHASATHKVVGRFNDLEKAVHALMAQAQPGDVILLSPGCASFGLFRNEFDRGEQFIKIVQDILG